MADTIKRLAGPAQLAAAAATLYTTPAVTTATIRHIRVTNPDTVTRTFTMSITADAASTRSIADAKPIPAGRWYESNGPWVLAAGEILQGFASTATKLVYEIDGVETT